MTSGPLAGIEQPSRHVGIQLVRAENNFARAEKNPKHIEFDPQAIEGKNLVGVNCYFANLGNHTGDTSGRDHWRGCSWGFDSPVSHLP